MKIRPIIFSSLMVRALLSGEKTQTRRIAKPQTADKALDSKRYGVPGDRLWVKETWRTSRIYDGSKPSLVPKDAIIDYLADQPLTLDKPNMSKTWRTSLFMPKRFSRIELGLTNIRYEKLSQCSETDAIAEGVLFGNPISMSGMPSALTLYKQTWESIHGENTWSADPWVWVLEFNRVFN